MNPTEDSLLEKALAQIDLLKQLSAEEKKLKNDDMKAMIRYYVSMTDQIEARRTRFYEFSLQYFVILIAATAVVLSQFDRIQSVLLRWAVVIFLFIQVAFTLGGAILYFLQSRYRYPFLKIEGLSNQWKWFYYGNAPVSRIKTSVWCKINEMKEARLPYMEGLLNFISNYHQETLDDEIERSVLQLYLLQVHNYYKNRFYLQLYAVGTWWIFTTAGYLLLVALLAICVVLSLVA